MEASVEDRRNKFCVIGAGSSGLSAMKYLKAENIPFDGIEAAADVGGLWLADQAGSPMYKNAHLISPKQVQMFSDYPMPESYPDFPNNTLVLEYLRSYANHFKLHKDIQFNTLVKKIEPIDSDWVVTLNDGTVRHYRGVVIANGHHNVPNTPEYPGNFTGEILHSRDYKDTSQLKGKRVLVVGAGQSAVDIAMESAIGSTKTFHSVRRKFLCLKRYIAGKPAEYLLNHVPIIKNLPIQIVFSGIAMFSLPLIKMAGINYKKWQIPIGKDNKVYHPIVGDKVYHYYADGDIIAKPDIREFKDHQVIFKDNTKETIDIVVFATGYKVVFPFIDHNILELKTDQSVPDLFLYIFHPTYNNLFFIGMINPLGAHWRTYEEQSLLVSKYIVAKDNNVENANDFEKRKIAFRSHDNKFFNALDNFSKYPLTVDKKKYSKELKRQLRFLSIH